MSDNTPDAEIERILLKFSSSEVDEMGIQQGAISVNTQLFTLEEATQAILQLLKDEKQKAALEGRVADIERILTASDKPKNKGFSGTWHGDMAAACGEVAAIHKELRSQLKQLNNRDKG
jgi:hypothetical protein